MIVLVVKLFVCYHHMTFSNVLIVNFDSSFWIEIILCNWTFKMVSRTFLKNFDETKKKLECLRNNNCWKNCIIYFNRSDKCIKFTMI